MGEGRGGYLTSAAIFAAATALWALLTRDDAFYGDIAIAGFAIPATMVAYLVVMPIIGFVVGRWRYERHDGGPGALLPKLGARAVHFLYAHSLIALFTAAMVAEAFFGLNLDAQVKAIDARVFDIAERFTPWLAAYLAGFNLGRFARDKRTSAISAGDGGLRIAARAEPHFADAFPAARDPDRDHADPRAPIAAPAVVADANDGGHAGPGFLPPQDLDALRPGFNQLR